MSDSPAANVKLIRKGNQIAMIFDASFLAAAGIDGTKIVLARCEGDAIVLSTASPSPEYIASIKRVHDEWAHVFAKLSEDD